MTHGTRFVVAVVSIVAAFAGFAVFATSAYSVEYPGQRAIQDTQTLQEIGLAVDYWAAHGTTGCPQGIAAYYADNLDGADLPGKGVAGRGGDCALWLAGPYFATLRDHGAGRIGVTRS